MHWQAPLHQGTDRHGIQESVDILRRSSQFELISSFEPKGDQAHAIDALTEGIFQGLGYQVLVGVTGSGKTFTIANVVARVQKPTLVIAPNKTLAAQLFGEFKTLFPHNAVEYFVSYYDYYQPEAYVPQTDTYIQKDASINEQIDRCERILHIWARFPRGLSRNAVVRREG